MIIGYSLNLFITCFILQLQERCKHTSNYVQSQVSLCNMNVMVLVQLAGKLKHRQCTLYECTRDPKLPWELQIPVSWLQCLFLLMAVVVWLIALLYSCWCKLLGLVQSFFVMYRLLLQKLRGLAISKALCNPLKDRAGHRVPGSAVPAQESSLLASSKRTNPLYGNDFSHAPNQPWVNAASADSLLVSNDTARECAS